MADISCLPDVNNDARGSCAKAAATLKDCAANQIGIKRQG